MLTLKKATLEEITAGANPRPVPNTQLEVQFNPASLKLDLANRVEGGETRGRQSRQYLGKTSTTLAFDLHFDTSDRGTTDSPVSVRTLTAAGRAVRAAERTGQHEAGAAQGAVPLGPAPDRRHHRERLDRFRSVRGQRHAAARQGGRVDQGAGREVRAPGSSGPARTRPRARPRPASRAPVPAAPAVARPTAVPRRSPANRWPTSPPAWDSIRRPGAGSRRRLGASSSLSLQAGLSIDFSSSLSVGAGIGVSAGVEAGAGVSLGASFGLELPGRSAEVHLRAPARRRASHSLPRAASPRRSRPWPASRQTRPPPRHGAPSGRRCRRPRTYRHSRSRRSRRCRPSRGRP